MTLGKGFLTTPADAVPAIGEGTESAPEGDELLYSFKRSSKGMVCGSGYISRISGVKSMMVPSHPSSKSQAEAVVVQRQTEGIPNNCRWKNMPIGSRNSRGIGLLPSLAEFSIISVSLRTAGTIRKSRSDR